MQKHEIESAKEVYKTFWDSFVNGNAETLASTIDDNFEYIGSTDTEVYHNKKEMMDFYESYKDDVAGKAEIRNRQIDVIPLQDLILVNERSELFALVEDEWVFYAMIRFSALIWNTNDGWKLIQTHNSFPDMRAQDGEILAFDKLKEENVILQEAVKQRTFELENKNLELQNAIENLHSTQAQLIQSEKMASLGELTAGIAHEIQNPLNFVNNFSEVSNELMVEMTEELDMGNIEEAKAISTDIKSNLEKINHHGKRASDIVKGMLEHSRKSSGTKEPTDINALADEYLRLAYHGIRAKDKDFNATMETHFDSNLPKIDIIPQDIGRVILNFINNAFYAVNERSKNGENGYQPTVSVSSERVDSPSEVRGERGKGDFIQIAISDNGSGIPDTIKDKIFQPFFTTKPTGQGTGLGLSLSYDIVKAHGGSLEVLSTHGVGSEFIIILPFKTNGY